MERTAVRFEKKQDSRKNSAVRRGERSSRIPGWDGEADTYFHMQDVLGRMSREPKYKNVIFVDPDLRHK